MEQTGHAAAEERTREAVMAALEPQVSTKRLVRYGCVLWALAAVVLWSVPALHAGDRSWWKWVPVAGLALGGIGYAYLARGRGNAAGAD